MKNKIFKFRRWLKGFVLEQKCIPWFLWEKLYEYRAILFNINNQKYWNKVWGNEIGNIPDYRLYINKFNRITELTPSRSNVLDIGCGLGILMERLLNEKNCKVMGIDISKAAVEYVKKKGMNAIIKKVPPLPFRDSSFDIVIATEIIEHCSNPLTMLDEILRVLNNSGKFFITVPENHGPDSNREHLKKYTYNSIKKFVSLRVNKFNVEQITEDTGWSSNLLVYGIKTDM